MWRWCPPSTPQARPLVDHWLTTGVPKDALALRLSGQPIASRKVLGDLAPGYPPPPLVKTQVPALVEVSAAGHLQRGR